MKFRELTSIGHNVADSFASGMGFLIGVYEMEVFREAAASPEGFILVDFIAGTSTGAQPSDSLAKAISLYARALDGLCGRHGIKAAAFRELKARYSLDSHGPRFIVTVQDQSGRRSVDEYLGSPGRRVMELDELGRVRPKRQDTRPEAE
ncbi:hypothetical protein CDO28_01390 [Sinorhizobium meliloti]|uniref:hypothetical protein n=1 Tax=Rhizobium meliloti TaxID=382 RepID=UPI000B4A31A1|nr:hypothetical protein [Sinorhizobium meliloti]ASP70344.1 hypothetical protein CDO28_01390 [Sinorhizobium meliloti]MDE3854779.1 hypothetical protein [Sinorhizobium meliloti]MQW52456.1 hypothetical protein [Sinorhizobium meliloti]